MKLIAPVAAILTAGVLAGAAMTVRSEPAAEIAAFRPPVLPSRTSLAPPAIPEPPSLPEGAEMLPPIRFSVTTTWSGPQGRRTTSQWITRTVDRLHLRMLGTDKEWLFERNPIDRRRVSGYLIEHGARQILMHQESDLRHEQQLRGWADAFMMRFDPAVLARLRRTDQRDGAFGATFTRYVAEDMSADGVLEVWWSDALLLPLRQHVRQRGVLITSVLTQLETPTALSMLADPRGRLTDYEALEVADSRERRH
jgi:hypothetical protein